MDYPERFSNLPEYAFPRLKRLLDGIAPGGPEISMSIGDPRHAFPDFVSEIVLKNSQGFMSYPPNEGTPGLRAAIAAWLARRYGVTLDPDLHIQTLNGTREGLFSACVALCPERKNGQRPAVLLPNPFYQCYAVAALSAGAEPVYVSATAETGFLPDFASLPRDLLDRTGIVYMCSPSNPQGAVADTGYWRALFELAETHDFCVFADECYSEIYRDAPPTGALEALHGMGGDPERLMVFHSLSKRSNLAGLRAGFAASGPGSIATFKQFRAYVGAPQPLPLQHAAEAAWGDEAHVEANRALYAEKFHIADKILGNISGYSSPQAGFFLWIRTGDGEATAKKLWAEAGVKVLPGAYLARDPGDGGPNPGAAYIRVAMVAPKDDIESGLTAIRRSLET